MKNKSLGFVRTITYLVLLSLMVFFVLFCFVLFVCLFYLLRVHGVCQCIMHIIINEE